MRASLRPGELGPHLQRIADDFRAERGLELLELEALWRSTEGARQALFDLPAVQGRPHLLVRWHLHGSDWPVPPRFVLMDRRLTIRLKAGPRCLLEFEPPDAAGLRLTFTSEPDEDAEPPPRRDGRLFSFAAWDEAAFRAELEAVLAAYDGLGAAPA